jgi:hypothetical protein
MRPDRLFAQTGLVCFIGSHAGEIAPQGRLKSNPEDAG